MFTPVGRASSGARVTLIGLTARDVQPHHVDR